MAEDQKQRDILGASWARMVDCIAHDLKSPLASVRMVGENLTQMLPELLEGYQLAVAQKLMTPKINEMRLKMIGNTLVPEVKKTIDSMFDFLGLLHPYNKQLLSSAPEVKTLAIKHCVNEALQKYAFASDAQRALVQVAIKDDFQFHAAQVFIDYLIAHLLDNALAAIENAGKGEITLWTEVSAQFNLLHFKDTALGMDETKLEHIFQRFFSKRNHQVIPGLGFCRLALLQIGGDVICNAVKGEYTDFVIKFPRI